MLFIDLIKDNLGTIVTLLAVLILVGALVLKLVKDKRAGRHGCSCGCSSCPMSAQCSGNKIVK